MKFIFFPTTKSIPDHLQSEQNSRQSICCALQLRRYARLLEDLFAPEDRVHKTRQFPCKYSQYIPRGESGKRKDNIFARIITYNNSYYIVVR